MPDILHDRVLAALGDAYDVGHEVGRGGMGVVYRATDRKLRRAVAIKVLPPELAYRDDVKQRFLREAQTAAALSHPNIVPIYAVEERAGLVCFVMALVDGESLGTRIVRERHLPIEEVRSVLMAVTEALGYAHSRGTVHRDIKPDNILIDRATGRPMVTDFGIARAAEGDARLTLTGIAVGTPAYMSPEQAMGEREIDGRSDLYSLAIVGYQMVSGELPFQASNTPAMLMKHISEVPRPLRELRADAPAWLLSILARAMAKKPEDRFADAAALHRALTGRLDVAPRTDNAGSSAERDSPRLSSAWKHSVPRDALDASLSSVIREARATEQAVSEAARDAVAAANPGWRAGPLVRRPVAPVPPGLAPVPPWMPDSWRAARSEWRTQGRELQRQRRRSESLAQFAELPLSEKIKRFRRRSGSTVITVGMLAAINLAFSPGFYWFLFPAAGMAIGLLHRAASLWADGVRFKDVFGSQAREHLADRALSEQLRGAPPPAAYAGQIAPPEVLAGRHGSVVLRAAQDRATIREAVAKLTKADRDLIPDVLPTVDALAERVGSLSGSLHRLDEDVQPEAVADLQARLESTKSRPESKEREQRVLLLERQLATMNDLMARRETLAAQLESASLMLQNMRLDLIALRSAGVQSVLNDVGSPTQDARAISRDIANALAAAKEVR